MSATTFQRRLLGLRVLPHPRAAATNAGALAPVGLFALTLALGFHRLGTKSLWLDEAVSAQHARLGAGGLWRVVSGGDPNMGLYYVLLHAWTGVFGVSEAAVRSLSVVLGALAVPVLAALGVRLFGRRAGLCAGLLLALSPFFTTYLQTARAYALLVTLVSLSCLLFVDLVRADGAPAWSMRRAAYVAVTALALYAHYFAALIIVVQLGALVVTAGRAARQRVWLATATALGVLCLPAAVFAGRDGTGQVSWIRAPALHNVVALPSDLAGGGLLAKAVIVLAAVGLIHGARHARWAAGFTAAWLAVPVALAFAISRVAQPLFVDYYLIVVLPALLLAAGAGLAALPARAPVAVAVLAIAGLSATAINGLYHRAGPEDYRAAARYLAAHERPGDSVLYAPAGSVSGPQTGFAYYLRSDGAATARPATLAAAGVRLWVIVRRSDLTARQQRALIAAAGRHYTPAAAAVRFANLQLALYTRR